MSTSPQFVSVPKTSAATISTANASRTGSGTIGTIFTAGSNGSRIDKIVIHAQATVTAGALRFFIHDGTNYFLFKEIPVVAITPAATTPAFSAVLSQEIETTLPLILPTGYSLRASTEKAESFNIIAIGGDF